MPIKRFADFLHRRGELQDYMDLLVRNFNPDTVEKLMCLDMISVGWDGKMYDCDFNQQLGYAVGVDGIHKGGKTVFDVDSLNDLLDEGLGPILIALVVLLVWVAADKVPQPKK
eukprot:CAMPEP_0113464644 /NCGR_PEP_ID=MMETSP0014_2-20120614/13310_1 /TAXON_ID=2857 /ORGANISM="Nitzschia sp." /LENGTH=112 /DNA_ID=CAMNT_0000356737 /DNA_START=1098 /DNA_END=1437 /DNA_ORIENTATION=+ /assembly_acc=CAM_ASM_000159